jgi:hypothetical protein
LIDRLAGAYSLKIVRETCACALAKEILWLLQKCDRAGSPMPVVLAPSKKRKLLDPPKSIEDRSGCVEQDPIHPAALLSGNFAEGIGQRAGIE